MEARLRDLGEPMKVFKQGKDITQVGLLKVRFDIARVSRVIAVIQASVTEGFT